MMYCPKCRAEYRPGFTRCSDCGVDLVNVLPTVAKQSAQTPSKGGANDVAGLGCLVLASLACVLIWASWSSAFGCLLADKFDYVTKQCALIHLRKPACNTEEDILDVDEVSDSIYTDGSDKRQEVRTVIYTFRKRPVSGPVSDAVMRDTSTLLKLQNGEWVATCEEVTPDKRR